jgi:hypothetical protein
MYIYINNNDAKNVKNLNVCLLTLCLTNYVEHTTTTTQYMYNTKLYKLLQQYNIKCNLVITLQNN